LHNSKSQLEIWKKRVDEFLRKELKLELHSEKSKIISLHKGTCFLGFRIFYYYKLLKKSNTRQMRRNLFSWKVLFDEDRISYEKLIERLEGWLAQVRQGNTYLLRKDVLKEFEKIYYEFSNLNYNAAIKRLIN